MSGVAWDLNVFHSVEKGRENILDFIGCADEQYFGKIYFCIHEVIFEFDVLDRIQNFHDSILKACSSWSIHYFIYLIQKNDWILSLSFENSIKYFSRIRSNICFAMSFH